MPEAEWCCYNDISRPSSGVFAHHLQGQRLVRRQKQVGSRVPPMLQLSKLAASLNCTVEASWWRNWHRCIARLQSLNFSEGAHMPHLFSLYPSPSLAFSILFAFSRTVTERRKRKKKKKLGCLQIPVDYFWGLFSRAADEEEDRILLSVSDRGRSLPRFLPPFSSHLVLWGFGGGLRREDVIEFLGFCELSVNCRDYLAPVRKELFWWRRSASILRKKLVLWMNILFRWSSIACDGKKKWFF